ncbi:MAG: hypothetical protein KDD40_09115 [Bdellovibrionales bacterium]|nr:hypothetical protein [Bdellovibrionales bacterium]
MKTFSIVFALMTLAGGFVKADLICGEATYECVNPINEEPIFESKKTERFCTINENLTAEELLKKLNYYEICNSYDGVVKIGIRNK